jgi:hypothetical protein
MRFIGEALIELGEVLVDIAYSSRRVRARRRNYENNIW